MYVFVDNFYVKCGSALPNRLPSMAVAAVNLPLLTMYEQIMRPVRLQPCVQWTPISLSAMCWHTCFEQLVTLVLSIILCMLTIVDIVLEKSVDHSLKTENM